MVRRPWVFCSAFATGLVLTLASLLLKTSEISAFVTTAPRTRRFQPFYPLAISNALDSPRNFDQDDYDVIIIGSGMGSLVAGNFLVRAGRRVLMLESHSIPGGYTTNFYRKGFRFEVSNHMITGCERGGAVGDLLHLLQVHDRIQFIRLKELMRWIDPARHIDYVVPLDLREHVRQLSQLFPNSSDGIHEFYQLYYPIVEFVLKDRRLHGLDKILNLLFNIPVVVRLLLLKGKTAADILDPLVKDPACRDIMTIMASIFGLDYTELDAPIFLFGSMAHFCEGAFYPQGGSGKLSRVLANQFRERGGDLRVKQHAEEILFENKRPVGVRIAAPKPLSTKTVRAACVIVGCDTNELVTKLCSPGSLPETYVKNILDRVPGPSAVLVWAGLDIDLREHGFTTYEVIRNHNVEHSAAELLNHVMRTGDYSILPFSGVTIYSNIDPTCCPRGKSVITSIFIASEDVFERALASNGAYKALKERVQGQFMKHMSSTLAIPDLAKHAEVVEVATPITLKRYTGHREGSFMGWKLTPDQGAFSNMPEQPPVLGLFSCGQWVDFGGVSNVMTTGLRAGKMADRFLERYKSRPRHSIQSRAPEQNAAKSVS